ncbi:hypothetical protein AAFF_G00231730 [Aldrovandia affinis]|uniref:Uncharacterized protein n=1 Tax=Aldrovandia affinis TaxID=143900 RepID=A0AAD7RF73_9TELE|nr:hypothetical protein AAFF_G00231730 [Aldrovandia affinis]
MDQGLSLWEPHAAVCRSLRHGSVWAGPYWQSSAGWMEAGLSHSQCHRLLCGRHTGDPLCSCSQRPVDENAPVFLLTSAPRSDTGIARRLAPPPSATERQDVDKTQKLPTKIDRDPASRGQVEQDRWRYAEEIVVSLGFSGTQ